MSTKNKEITKVQELAYELKVEQAMKPGFSTAPEWVREMGFGAGMGLPNIKSCVDKLDIQSKVGEGTRLEFIIYMKEE